MGVGARFYRLRGIVHDFGGSTAAPLALFRPAALHATSVSHIKPRRRGRWRRRAELQRFKFSLSSKHIGRKQKISRKILTPTSSFNINPRIQK